MSNECWDWPWAIGGNGYGYIRDKKNGKTVSAHRYAWEEWNGPIPNSMHVLHACDNPRCVNPDHLFLGNHRDNMHDMFDKRGVDICGKHDGGWWWRRY